MKKILFAAIIFCSLFLQSCNLDTSLISAPASRHYEQDVTVLNEFVDINKTTHEYFINPNKRSGVMSYITNADAEELDAVNSLNLSVFQESLSRINGLSGQLAVTGGVDYIVMITENDIYISRIKNDSPVNLKRKISGNGAYSSTIASLNVTDYNDKQYIGRSNSLGTSIELNPQTYKFGGWAFLVTCEMADDGNKETASVLFCGVGYNINPSFEWTATTGHKVEWTFGAMSRNNDAPYIANLKFLR